MQGVACYTIQRRPHHLSLHMVFYHVMLPLLHQEWGCIRNGFTFGFSLWLLLFREHGRPEAVTLWGIVFNWPGHFGFLLLGSQLPNKTTILWEDQLLHEVALVNEKLQNEVGIMGEEGETKQHHSITHASKSTISDIQCCLQLALVPAAIWP